jgi:NAD(P)-dependent dehydrogenase (short-subunit alcohol dehydrogenase family)
VSEGPLDDLVVAITGGGTGIGAATAELAVEQGARVLIAGLGPAELEATAAPLGDAAAWLELDVTEPDAGERLVAGALEAFGALDVLVNCAGVAWLERAEDVSRADWLRVIDINLNGLFFVTQAAGRHFIAQGSGAIVNVASMAGLNGMPEHSGYVASKHAVVGLTKALAIEWARHGVRVNALCPGLTRTPIVAGAAIQSPGIIEGRARRTLLGRLAEAGEQAAMICFLASPAAGYVNGLIANVDGGNHALYSGYDPLWHETTA